MARRPTEKRRGTAYHEAGHATVFLHLGLPIHDVSIIADDSAGSWGSVTHPSVLGLDLGPSMRERRRVARDMILGCYAGLHAQRIVEPTAPLWHAAQGDAHAFELSRTYGVCPKGGVIGDEAHLSHLDRLRADAGRLVKRLRVQIDHLAAVLLERDRLSAAEVAGILNSRFTAESGSLF